MRTTVTSNIVIGLIALSCFLGDIEIQSASSGFKFSRDSVYNIIEALELKKTDIVVVIADEGSLAQKLYELSSVKELIVAIKDSDTCEDFEHMLSKDGDMDRPHMRVVCGKADAVDISSATAIIVTALDVDLVSLAKRVTTLPDGVKLLVREQLEYDQDLYLNAIRTIAVSATQGITMYEYVVKRPSPADMLNDLYVGMTGFGISQDEADVIREAGGDPTYGEIELKSAEQIFSKVVPIGPDDVFYDLGCGIGKLVLWVYLATPAKKSVGIELCGSRFESAAKAKDLMKEKILPKYKPVMIAQWGDKVSRKVLEIMCANIVDADLRDATIIYMCATCYPDELMKAMTDKFVTLKDGLRIVTLKELPDHPFIHMVGKPQRFPMTWSHERGSPVYVYEMRRPSLRDVLEKAYQQVTDVTASDESKPAEVSVHELSYEAGQKILNNILMLTSKDVFYHLGCGNGRLALQAYLTTPVKRVVGVDASEVLFKESEKAQEAMKELLENSPYDELWANQKNVDEKAIEFLKGSVVENIASAATKIFIDSAYVKEIAENIGDFCKKLSPDVRIATLKKFDACPDLQLVKAHTVEDSGKKITVYEYVHASDGEVSAAKPESAKKKTTSQKSAKKAK